MEITIQNKIIDDECREVGEIDCSITIGEDSNIHGYIDAIVLALKAETFSPSTILKGFKNYVDAEEGNV